MAALTSIGQSDSQNASRNNVRRIYTLFAQSTDTADKFKKYPEFHNLPEQLACSTALYEQFSHFLVHVYKIEQRGPNCGQPLMFSSVLDYLGILVNMAADTYLATGTNDTKLFFTCLDINSTTRAAKWWRGLRANIKRLLFQRTRDAWEQPDNSETPVYSGDICRMNAAYAKKDTGEAARRKLVLTTLQRCAGRTSEVAWVTWDGLEWDQHFM